jgi:DNA-directed RNA polymerase beta subunit
MKEHAYFPHEARLRNLTYAVDIYVMVQLVKQQLEPKEQALKHGRDQKILKILEKEEPIKCPLFKCPVMVRSQLCHLRKLND